jgi:hypothetical protein
MTEIEEDLKGFFDLLLDIKKILLQLKKYKGNPNYKKAFLDKVKKLHREHKFLKAKIAKNYNQKLKKEFKKIEGDIETITEYKNPESSLEEIDFIEKHWPDIEITLDEDEIDFQERIYDRGSRFDFHLDVKEIINSAIKDLFIIEPYVEDHLLEITLKGVNKDLNIRILTNANNMKYSGNFTKLGHMFKSQQKGIFEVRESTDIHDRGIFCDLNDGWVMGQSIKDGAKRPTYLIKLREPKKLKQIYEKIWNTSKKII